MLDFEASKSKSEKMENYFFLENYILIQREPFLTMFYTINLSHYSLPMLMTYLPIVSTAFKIKYSQVTLKQV